MLARTLLAAAALCAAWIAPASARDLRVAVRQPDLLAPWRTVFITPFANATTIAITASAWSGGAETLQQRLKSPDSGWDLVMVDGEELASGCSAGLFEKLDWSQIGGKDHYTPIAVSDCGVGATVANVVLAWDRDKLSGNPSWADFWDVTKFPAKRGLHKGVRGNLEIALMADGVAPQDVYKVLGTSDGLDRAFRKLDQLRPYIVWWDTPEDAARILGSGDVLMTSAPSPAIVAAARATHRNFGMQWSGSVYRIFSWAAVKASPDLRDAMQFLYYSGTSAIEAQLVRAGGYGGLAKGANDGLPPELEAISPTTQANLQGAVKTDVAFWQSNLAKLSQRFDAWLAH